jgi:hypothetical protein
MGEPEGGPGERIHYGAAGGWIEEEEVITGYTLNSYFKTTTGDLKLSY